VKTTMQEAAKKREMRYSDLKKIDRGVRQPFVPSAASCNYSGSNVCI
jgi:hypothetical protein